MNAFDPHRDGFSTPASSYRSPYNHLPRDDDTMAAATVLSSIHHVAQPNETSPERTLVVHPEQREEELPSLVATTILAEGPHLVLCAYSEVSNDIYYQSTSCSGHETEELLEDWLQQVQPNMVLVHPRVAQHPTIMALVTRNNFGATLPTSLEGNGSNEGIPYRILQSRAWNKDSCLRLILDQLIIKSWKSHRPLRHHAHDPARQAYFSQLASYRSPASYHAVASFIDLEDKYLVQALGALLGYLQSELFRHSAPEISIDHLSRLPLKKYMHISPSTLQALQVFHTEHHPLWGGKNHQKSKEGFSLHSWLDMCKSQEGKRVLKEWMTKPLLDRNEILSRQDSIDALLRPEVRAIVGHVLQALVSVGHVTNLVYRLQKCTGLPANVLQLAKSCAAGVQILKLVQHHLVPPNADESLLLVQLVQKSHMSVLEELQQRIHGTIEDSDGEVRVKDGVDAELDFRRNALETLSVRLRETRRMVQQTYPTLANSPFAAQVTVTFITQVGFLVGVPTIMCENWSFPLDWELIFSQPDMDFFKDPLMHQLDTELGDLEATTRDMEDMIIKGLEDDVLHVQVELRETFLQIGQLDCLLAFATLAIEEEYVRPTILSKEAGTIEIVRGRHVLQENVLPEGRVFVANDTMMNNDDKRLMVLTGPNYSGKSCYARQVGLLVYLAQIGAFVPAESATISICESILTQMPMQETCQVPQSSFQSDLTRMAAVLRQATPYSLVLMDEFGKGTSPASGIALLAASLKHLSQSKAKVIATTHFLELFTMNVLSDGRDGIVAYQMVVHLPGPDDPTAEPLFRLEAGIADSSSGLVCARQAGLESSILERAAVLQDSLRQGRIIQRQDGNVAEKRARNARNRTLRIFLQHSDWSNASDLDLKELLASVIT